MKIKFIFIVLTGVMLILSCTSLEHSIMWPGAATDHPVQDSRIQRHWLNTEQDSVEVWFIPAVNDPQCPKPAVICAHGNGECLDWVYASLLPYTEMGIHLVLCEYRGYGRSGGTPSQANITQDFIRCYDWVRRKAEVDSTRIFVQGTSIGSGIACALAGERETTAIVLIAPLQSTYQLAKDKFPLLAPFFKLFGGFQSPFRNDRFLMKYGHPVLILHGNQDEVIPFRHGQYLHGLCAQSTFVELDSGHNNILTQKETLWESIRSFLGENALLSTHEQETSDAIR